MAYMKLIVTTLALWLNQTTPALARAKTLTVSVDDELVLYIDGDQQTNLNNTKDFNKAKKVRLDHSPVLIAVQGTNYGGPAGIIGSMSDGTFVTDLSWRCSNILLANWYAINFDDSAWPVAVNGSATTTIPGVSSAATWVWTKSNDAVVYCRGYPKTLAITVDDEFDLYIDGVQQTGLPNSKFYSTFDFVDVPKGVNVIAVRGADLYGYYKGIIASIAGTKFVTDFSWKCTDTMSTNWFATGFNDSSWPAAVQGSTPPPTYPNINPSAKFIWTTNLKDYAVVYCRARL